MSSNRKRKRSPSYQALQQPTDIPGLKAYFQRHSVDVNATCTAGQDSANHSAERTAQRRCWITENLSLWNNILHNVGMELREHSTGNVRLQTFVLCNPSSTEFRDVSAFLLKLLLNDHHCVERIDLRYSGELFGDKSQLVSQIALSSGVQQINIDGRRMSKMEVGKLVRVVLRGKPLQIALHSIFWGPTEMTALVRNIETGTRLVDLDLSDTGLKGCDCIRLFEVIETCTTLKSLKLDSNMIGLRGAQRFATLLSTNATLTKVSLFRTRLKDKGAAAIGDALAANKTLRILTLGANSIGSSGAKAIASALRVNTSLVRLDLQHNNLENIGAIFFAQSLKCNKTLRELHLCWNSITDDGVVAIADSLANQRTLQFLAIRWNHFGERGFEAIAHLVATNNTLTDLNITSILYLSSAVIFNHFAEALARNRTLQSIELEVLCSPAVSTLSRALRSHGTLRELSIRNSGVTDLSVLFSALANNRSIQSFALGCIQSTENVEGLKNLLSKTTTLRSVTISYGACNASLMQLVSGLVDNTSIWKFHVGSQKLGINACKSIAAMLAINKTLRFLDLDAAPIAHEAGLRILAGTLAGNRSLQQLRVAYSRSSAAGFQVSESLRRNGNAFCRAIQFVLGKATDRDSAAAFQQHESSEFFKHELSLLPEVLSPWAAMCLIRKASNCILEDFFMVTGVVNRSVQCPKPRRTRRKPEMQFDKLNADCMFHIASFLKVVDVKNP